MDVEISPSNAQVPSSESIQPSLYAALIACWILSVTAVSLRLLARRLTKAPLWLDDWLVIAALVTAFGYGGTFIFWVNRGLGRHYDAVNTDVTIVYHDFFLAIWIADIFYSFTLALVKLSLLSLYWRIFNVYNIKLPIKVLAGLVISWLIVRIVVVVCHCFPVQGYWDKSIDSSCPVDDWKFLVGTVFPHLVMDLMILTIPIPGIKSLQISLNQKIGVFCMFLFGGFVCFASVIQLVTCWNLDAKSPDVTWNYAKVGLWATVEVFLATVSACLPLLRPIYLLITGKSKRRPIRHNWEPKNEFDSLPSNLSSTPSGQGKSNSSSKPNLEFRRPSMAQLASFEFGTGFISNSFVPGLPFTESKDEISAHIGTYESRTTCESNDVVRAADLNEQRIRAIDQILVRNEIDISTSSEAPPWGQTGNSKLVD